MIWEYSNLKDKDENFFWQEGYCYTSISLYKVEVPENMIHSRKYFGRRDIVTLACYSFIFSASIFGIDFMVCLPLRSRTSPLGNLLLLFMCVLILEADITQVR
jgi:hypothetical protein